MLWQSILLALLPASPCLSYSTLTDESLRSLPDAGHDFDITDGALLAPILIPRVPGTPGSTAVLNHLASFFQRSLPEWTLSFQNSTSVTPTSEGKEVPFVNLIATRDPPWTTPGEVGRLALVAHYDSLQTPEGFIGAIDSAAPCAMLMHAARSIDGALTRKWAAMEAEGVGEGGFDGVEQHQGVQVIMLDGEEAFLSWTATDSLYGARSLAEEWETTLHPATSTYRSPIDSIDLFVLLDLLGAKDATVPSYYKTTHWAYKNMAAMETRMRSLGLMKSSPNFQSKGAAGQVRKEALFLNEASKGEDGRWLGGYIGDDHVPFMSRGVDILHMIAHPFPHVWHTIDDDGEHLDIPTVEDWAKMVTAFAAEWLDLDAFMTAEPSDATDRKNTRSVKDEL